MQLKLAYLITATFVLSIASGNPLSPKSSLGDVSARDASEKQIRTSRSDVNQTFDAYVLSNFTDFLGQGNFTAPRLDLEDLRKFDAELTQEFGPSLELSERFNTPALFNHSLRMYYFSLVMMNSGFPSNTPSVPQITRDELIKRVYIACVLHELGLSTNPEATTHGAHTMTFEFHGGIMTYEHLQSVYQNGTSNVTLDASEVGDITQSIMLHTSIYNAGMSSATAALVHLSAYFDVGGYGAFGTDSMEPLFNRDTVRDIEGAFPRGNMTAEVGVDFSEMVKVKPDCLITHAPAGTLEQIVKGVTSLADSH